MYQVWPIEKNRIKKIFTGNNTPEVHAKTIEYIEKELFPRPEETTEKQETERLEKITKTYNAALQTARRHGWLKSSHSKIGRGSAKQKGKEKKDQSPVLQERDWREPEIIEISKEAWEKPGSRVAYFSYGPYRTDGWRKDLFRLGSALAAQEGCHVYVFAGGIISKEWFTDQKKEKTKGVKKKYHEAVVEHIRQEVVRALQATLPQLKKPNGDLARWYIMSSKPYDGPEAEEIIRRLQEKRDDIRHYKVGGEKVEVRMADTLPNIFHGVVLPKRKRLSSKYMSARPESDIRDVEEQSSRKLPDLWVHAMSATALFKPSGEIDVPYITLPAIQKLEAEERQTAENQVGLAIVEEMPDQDRLIHFWSLRDLIAKEREFITGVKTSATDLQTKIIDIIKREGARHPGRIKDELNKEGENIDLETVVREITPLVEPRPSSRKTYPGIYYDEGSQRYDLHPEWIQEMLKYELPKQEENWQEDSFLLFGCLHAGYTTTDYEFVVRKFPEYILKYDIRVIAGIGDFIAGLRHDFMHSGEILNMNYTEQETFAAELIATVIYKVFIERFKKNYFDLKDKIIIHPAVLPKIIEDSLPLFLFIEGNHDEWTKRDGHTPLEKFRDKLISLLARCLTKFIIENNLAIVDPTSIVEKIIKWLPVHRPIYTLPSGIKIGLMHPHMARADTSSLRGEKALKLLSRKGGCQIVGIANFHVHILGHKWSFKNGQTVFAQTATEVLFTPFELSKIKDTDFGPLYLRTLSHNGRIYKTTMASFNQPILQEPIPKWTNTVNLKEELGLLGY